MYPPGRDLYQGISEPAALGSRALLHPVSDHVLTWFWTLLCPRVLPHVIPQHPKAGSASARLCAVICLPLSLGRKHYLTIALLAPARFPAPSCQAYPAFSSSPPPAPRLSGRVCISVSCRLSSPCPRPPALAPCSILPERLRPEPKLARVR